MAQIMNSLLLNSDLKKVGKTTRPFRYDLNQIPYDYTVEVTNRFKGLDLIGRMPGELWMEVHDSDHEKRFMTRGSDQDHPQEKKTKWLFEEAYK